MGWLILWIGLTLTGLIGTIASINSVRFGRRVTEDARKMWKAATDPLPIDAQSFAHLPAPVQRYLRKALGDRTRPLRAVRLRHGGTFRTSLEGGWVPIRGQQYFSTSPPSFVWWGRVRMAPGLWVDAHDRSVQGSGRMFVTLESTLTLADSRGAELDQSALQRLLGELPWLPTTLLDARYVTWTAIDERRAKATLELDGHRVDGIFEFGPDDLPKLFRAERYRDVGGGKSVLTPFTGEGSDFRRVNGLLVPHRMVGSWHVDGKAIPYARFEIEELELDPTETY